MRRHIDELIILMKYEEKSDAELKSTLDQIQTDWTALDEESPEPDQRFIDEAIKKLRHQTVKLEK